MKERCSQNVGVNSKHETQIHIHLILKQKQKNTIQAKKFYKKPVPVRAIFWVFFLLYNHRKLEMVNVINLKKNEIHVVSAWSNFFPLTNLRVGNPSLGLKTGRRNASSEAHLLYYGLTVKAY